MPVLFFRDGRVKAYFYLSESVIGRLQGQSLLFGVVLTPRQLWGNRAGQGGMPGMGM